MELGEWVCGRIIENSDNRSSDNRGSTIHVIHRENILTESYVCDITGYN